MTTVRSLSPPGIKGGEDLHLSKTYNIFNIWFAHKNGKVWILNFTASNDQIIFSENYFISLSNASAPYEKHKTVFFHYFSLHNYLINTNVG